MKDSRKFVFVGNREFLLRKMIEKGLNVVKVWVIKDSYLERKLKKEKIIEYEIIMDKIQLFSYLFQQWILSSVCLMPQKMPNTVEKTDHMATI